MRPLLSPGQLLETRDTPPAHIRPGDCVAYRLAEGRTLVHRVWWKTAAGFWVNDDAATCSLHFVPAWALAGRVEGASPLLRGLLGWVWGVFSHACHRFKRSLLSPQEYQN